MRESPSKIKVYNQFKEKLAFRPHFAAEGLYGGVLMGLRSTDFICFYDWEQSRVIRRLDVAVKDVWWSDSGELVAEELRGVHEELGTLLGGITADDLLGEIFASFCIGK